jgi:Holin of 3TMs, for gene-transfer release
MSITGLGELAALGQTIAKALLPDRAQQEQDAAAFKIQQVLAQADVFKAQAAIVQAEVGGSGIKAWWRPVTMLVFVSIVVARFLGYDAKAMTPDDYAQLWALIKIGLGGYVGGRSLEKRAPVIAGAIAQRGGSR